MSALMLSTQEVASMLDVTETTIKRWADETLLKCMRTAGGHRKFLLRDIIEFAHANGYTIGGSEPPELAPERSDRLQVGVHTRNYPLIASVFHDEALHADREELLGFLMYLHRQRIPFPVIMDDVIRPAFQGIGDLWARGEIGVAAEHMASQATMEALVRMSPELHRKPANGKSALCACPENELHELGLRGLASVLECEGWTVHFLGANTPLETLSSHVQTVKADLVCISVTGLDIEALPLDGMRRVIAIMHAYGGKLIFGGFSAAAVTASGIDCDYVGSSIGETIAYLRDAFGLKPGPKKKMPSPEGDH